MQAVIVFLRQSSMILPFHDLPPLNCDLLQELVPCSQYNRSGFPWCFVQFVQFELKYT